MKKKLLLRGALGFPIGIAIGYVITICISLVWAGGYYSPCVPELAEALGSEIGAVALQALLCGLLGVGFAASSVIWGIQFAIGKRNVKKMNEKISEEKQD